MIQFVLIAMFGAFVEEFSHWYEKRKELKKKEFQILIKSKEYWLITGAMIIISGFGTYLLFKDDIIGKSKAIFIMGAAFPLIFKKLVKSTTAADPELGILQKDDLEFNPTKLYFK